MSEPKSHPAADIFPMMREDELAALAADIKANGQQHPIIVDAEGRILDGRNRHAACKLAGVEPRIAEANGADPLDLVVSLNVKRRNMSKSQAAVAGAEWLQVNFDSDEVTNAVRRRIAKRFNTSDGYIQQARTLVTDAPDLAALVKTGDLPLAEGYAKWKERDLEAQGTSSDLEAIRADHPDLAEQVEAGSLSLPDARAQAKKRADEEKQKRWAATQNVVDVIQKFGCEARPDIVRHLAQSIDPQTVAAMGQEINAEKLRQVAEFAAALADELEESK